MKQIFEVFLKDIYMYDYAKEFSNKDGVKFPNFMIPQVVQMGFIEWTDHPEAWVGPWTTMDDKKYVLCVVTDHSHMADLPMASVVIAQKVQQLKYDVSNFPATIQKKLLGDAMYFTRYADDGVERRSSYAMTHAQFMYAAKAMSNNEVIAWEADIADQLGYFMKDLFPTIPTVENPILIKLCGTDNCCYSNAVATKEMAYAYVEGLDIDPKWDTLKTIGFKFDH